MTDNRVSDQKIDQSVRDGLRVPGLIDNGHDNQPSMPNLPPELPSTTPQFQLVTRIGSTGR